MYKVRIEVLMNDQQAAENVAKAAMNASGLTWEEPPGSDKREQLFRTFFNGEAEMTMRGEAWVRPAANNVPLAEETLLDVQAELQRLSNERYTRSYGDIIQQINELLAKSERDGRDAIRVTKALVERMIAFLRGMEIVVMSVGDAGTHREKDARLRGLSDVIQRAINACTEFHFDFGVTNYRYVPDLFKSDFPVREHMQRIHDLEAEVTRLKIKAGEGKAEDVPSSSRTADPYSIF